MSLNTPIFFEPVLKHYIWGGRNLEKLGRQLPAGKKVAESWEISGHVDGMTKVLNGEYAGKTLKNLMEAVGEKLVGTKNQWALDRGKFPWLIKLLDANERLSIQVHPDDAYAEKHEDSELGKTEMWVVLWAMPDAAIIYGLKKDVNKKIFKSALEQGKMESVLNVVSIQAGDHICVPSGTLHAILGGAMIAEIQQNSNTTYRVYDWDRKDSLGGSRPLHIEKALDTINFNLADMKLSPPKLIENNDHWTKELLCENKYFKTERISCHKDSIITGSCDGSTMEVWGVIDGKATIQGEELSAVQFCLLPAVFGEYSVKSLKNSTLLRIYTP